MMELPGHPSGQIPWMHYQLPGSEILPNSSGARITMICFWWVVVVLVAAYNANLMSYLAVSERRLPFTTLEEAVADSSVEFYMQKSSVAETFIRVSREYRSAMIYILSIDMSEA